MVQLDVRQARYFGRSKTKLQCTLAAVVANLTLMVGLFLRLLLLAHPTDCLWGWLVAVMAEPGALVTRAAQPGRVPRHAPDFWVGGLCPDS